MSSAVEIDLRREQPQKDGPRPEKAAAADGRVPEDLTLSLTLTLAQP